MTKELLIICGMRCNAYLLELVRNPETCKEWKKAARKVLRERHVALDVKVGG